MPPKISVLMLVGPDPPYLQEALESLEKQTFQDFEILQQRERGIVAARNAGCRRARGKYIAILDSDDIAHPQRFERQVEYMERHPDVSVVGSWCRLFGSWGPIRGGMRRSKILTPPVKVTAGLNLMWARIPNSSAMMRRDDVLPFGPYRDVMLEDYDLWIRLLRSGKKLANIPEVLVSLRAHDTNHSKILNQSQVLRNEIYERFTVFKFWARSPSGG